MIALLIKVPMRLFGRWLERKGAKMAATKRDQPPDEPYNPFEAGRH